jgi:hypothetical protein
MGPKPSMSSSGDLYRSRLDPILDQRHDLVRLAGLINWDRLGPLRSAVRPLLSAPGAARQTHAPDGWAVLSPTYLQPVR